MDIQISQDIRKYKTKDIGNFSFKEAGFLVIGFGLAFITYKLTDSMEFAILPFAVVAVFAFLKPYGMTCFQFVRTWGKDMLLPSTYINETDFEYDTEELEKQFDKEIHVIHTDSLTQSNSVENKKSKKPNIYDEDLIIR